MGGDIFSESYDQQLSDFDFRIVCSIFLQSVFLQSVPSFTHLLTFASLLKVNWPWEKKKLIKV